MYRKTFRVSAIFLILILLSGCVPDSRELDQRSLIMGMAIDKGKEKTFSVTIQLPIYGEGTGGASVSPFARDFETFTSEGDTLWEAFSTLESHTPTVLFLGHLKAVVMSEDIAKENVRNILDLLERKTHISKQIYLVVVSNGSAKEFIDRESALVQLPSIYLNQYFSAGQKIARTEEIKLFEFSRDSNMISHAAAMPLAKIVNENEFEIEGLAIFENYQLKGELQLSQVAMSVLMKDNEMDGLNETVTIEHEGSKVVVSLTRIALKQKMDFQQTNPVQIHLDIKGAGDIIGLSDIEASVTKEVLEQVKVKMAKKIEDEIKVTIAKMQEINVEPWLFGHRIWARSPKYFETLNWNEDGWQNAQFQIDVKFDIKNSGQRGYLDKKKIGR